MPVKGPTVARLGVLAPALAVTGIIGLDLVLSARPWSLFVTGMLDESAHLLTAWLALAAVTAGRSRIWPWALLGAVAIDVDHVPLYLWNGLASVPGGRPVTHSLVTIVALGAVANAVPRWRVPLLGLGIGVLLHFVRDMATSPGLPLGWPMTSAHLLLPRATYLVMLLALGAVVAVRRGRAQRCGERRGKTTR